eukprot:48809_1
MGLFHSCTSSADSKTEISVVESRPKKLKQKKRDSSSQVKPDVAIGRRRLSLAPELVGSIDLDSADAGRRSSLDVVKEGISGAVTDGVDAEINSMVSVPIRVERVAATKRGYVPYNLQKKNQDVYIMIDSLEGLPDWSFYGVADGHGEFGHHVSSYVRDNIATYLGKSLREYPKDPAHAIYVAIESIGCDISKTKINTTFSGTTLCLAAMYESTIYTANVGDSRIIMARRSPTGELSTFELTTDQNASVPTEKARILAAGGRVFALPGPTGTFTGPQRVWPADVDIVGLAMTRSIGDDLIHQAGVIYTPEIRTYSLHEDDILLMAATDGLFEFISSEQAVDIAVETMGGSIETAVDELVQESVRLWKSNEQCIDDITVVLLKFTPSPPDTQSTATDVQSNPTYMVLTVGDEKAKDSATSIEVRS